MKGYITKMVAVACLVVPVSTWAYTYTFKNKVKAEVEVKFQLVGIAEPIETVQVPPMSNDGVPGVIEKSFGGLRIGLCVSMNTETLSARKLPNGNALYPLLISRNSKAFDELLKTGKITSVDFGVGKPCQNFSGAADAALKCNPRGMLCFNLEFEIYETDDNHLVLVFQ